MEILITNTTVLVGFLLLSFKKQDQKRTWGGKSWFHLLLPGNLPSLGEVRAARGGRDCWRVLLTGCHPGSSAQGRLHPSDLGPGILCFTTAGMKPHNQDNLEKKEFNWAYTSRGLASMMAKQEHGRERAGSSQPDPPAKGRERSRWGARTGNGTSFLKPQTLAPVTHLLPQGHTSKSFPTSSTEQGPSIQIYILLRAFLIQTTTVLSYHTSIKKMHHSRAHRPIGRGIFFPGSFFPNASSFLAHWHNSTVAQAILLKLTHHSPSVLNDLHHLPPESILECPKVLFLYHPCSSTSPLEYSNLRQPRYGTGQMTS